jgi:hypothetical protein
MISGKSLGKLVDETPYVQIEVNSFPCLYPKVLWQIFIFDIPTPWRRRWPQLRKIRQIRNRSHGSDYRPTA